MKKLSITFLAGMFLCLMSAPAFAVSLGFDYDQDGIVDDPCEFDLVTSSTITVDIWLIGWQGDKNVASVDYYFEWSTSMEVVSVSTYLKPGGAWDDEYHADIGSNNYAMGTVEFGSGVAGPDIILHSVTLHCLEEGDNWIKATAGVEGSVGNSEGDAYPMDDGDCGVTPVNSSGKDKMENKAEYIPGRWKHERIDDDQSEMFLRLESLGYLDGYKPAKQKTGVTVYDKELAFDGVNLYTSGHSPEALLIDMEGNILYKWSYDFDSVWPEMQLVRKQHKNFWRRVYLLDDGAILAIYEGIGMIKLDKDSNLLWSHNGWEHHDMDVINNDNICVLTRKLNKKRNILEDFVTILDPNGAFVREYSLLEMLEKSAFKHLFKISDRYRGYYKDIFHTNTIKVLDGSLAHLSPIFKKNNILISMNNLHVIAIAGLKKEEIVWASSVHENFMCKFQHEPVLLENGNILIFCNIGADEVYGRSKVIEINPFTHEVVWQYKGEKNNKFESLKCGTNQRLPNGNTLITESDNGRAFEVTPDKKIVWEYRSPYRAGAKNQLVATIFHMDRISDKSVEWLKDRDSIQKIKEGKLRKLGKKFKKIFSLLAKPFRWFKKLF